MGTIRERLEEERRELATLFDDVPVKSVPAWHEFLHHLLVRAGMLSVEPEKRRINGHPFAEEMNCFLGMVLFPETKGHKIYKITAELDAALESGEFLDDAIESLQRLFQGSKTHNLTHYYGDWDNALRVLNWRQQLIEDYPEHFADYSEAALRMQYMRDEAIQHEFPVYERFRKSQLERLYPHSPLILEYGLNQDAKESWAQRLPSDLIGYYEANDLGVVEHSTILADEQRMGLYLLQQEILYIHQLMGQPIEGDIKQKNYSQLVELQQIGYNWVYDQLSYISPDRQCLEAHLDYVLDLREHLLNMHGIDTRALARDPALLEDFLNRPETILDMPHRLGKSEGMSIRA